MGKSSPDLKTIRDISDLHGATLGRAAVRNGMLLAGCGQRKGARRVIYTGSQRNFFQSGETIARATHQGEHLKFVDDTYYTHVKGVSARMGTVPARTLAIMHDTPERLVEVFLGKQPETGEENDFIAGVLEEIACAFRHFGCHFTPHDAANLDALTKRRGRAFYDTWIAGHPNLFREANAWYQEKWAQHGTPLELQICDKYYIAYSERLLLHARQSGSTDAPAVKKSDTFDNSDPERNPAESVQTVKDHQRLAKYEFLRWRIDHFFPESEWPGMRLRDPHPAETFAAARDDKPSRKEGKHEKKPRRGGGRFRDKTRHFDF